MFPVICSHRMQKVNGRCPKCYSERMKNYSYNLNKHHKSVLPRAAQIRERRVNFILQTRFHLPPLIRPKHTLDYKCPICWNVQLKTEKMIYLPCGHVFHDKCINEWFKRKNTCPMCRRRRL
jgi:hypothetical protein